MRKECREYPGYFVVVEDNEVRFEKETEKGVKRIQDYFDGRRVYWRASKRGKQLPSVLAEKVVEDTFPGIERSSYLYSLYKGYHNKPRERTLTFEVTNEINLISLYHPYTYYLETPVEMNLEKEIKKTFPGPTINIEDGNEMRKWREIYFYSEECTIVVLERVKEMLNKGGF